jgi:hypothetical protein
MSTANTLVDNFSLLSNQATDQISTESGMFQDVSDKFRNIVINVSQSPLMSNFNSEVSIGPTSAELNDHLPVKNLSRKVAHDKKMDLLGLEENQDPIYVLIKENQKRRASHKKI